MTEPGAEHRTRFVAPTNEAKKAAPAARRASTTSDVRRVRPAWIAAVCGAATAAAAFTVSPAAPDAGPGPLTPPHVKAKLTCSSCHQQEDKGTAKFTESARGACVGCHGPHPSTREGHRKLASKGALGCTSCHTIHRDQSGVKLPADGPAVRYGTWGETTLDDLAFHNERTILVPTIPIANCLRCHEAKSTDPIARCRSGVGGDLEPSLCFDEHRVALPPDLPTVRPGTRPPAPKKAKVVCAEQHFDDRSFAWEVAREATHRVPVIPRSAAAKTPLGWLGSGALGAIVGYAATVGLGALRGRLRRRALATPARTPETRRLPMIDTSTCLGCHACVDACPYGVIEVERYVAVVARPDACCGLTLCEQRCPNGSLRMEDANAVLERPRVSPSLESPDMTGLYLCGDVTGVPLIKNAIAQGARAAEAAFASLSSRPRAPQAVDTCIVGAGPAGISAALRLKELGATTAILEQGGVAQSIQSFPRGKLVFDQPLELPVAGKLWLKESTKEELLLHWMRIVRREGLDIQEGTRMTAVSRGADGIFLIQAVGPDDGPRELRARTVLLAIGQRGTPRRLPVPVPAEAEGRQGRLRKSPSMWQTPAAWRKRQ